MITTVMHIQEMHLYADIMELSHRAGISSGTTKSRVIQAEDTVSGPMSLLSSCPLLRKCPAKKKKGPELLCDQRGNIKLKKDKKLEIKTPTPTHSRVLPTLRSILLPRTVQFYSISIPSTTEKRLQALTENPL